MLGAEEPEGYAVLKLVSESDTGLSKGGRVPPGAGATARDRSPSPSLLLSSLELSETQVYEP